MIKIPENPLNSIKKMKEKGTPGDDIINILQGQGNSNQQISEGMEQSNIVPEPPAQQAPQAQQTPLMPTAPAQPAVPAPQEIDTTQMMDVPTPEGIAPPGMRGFEQLQQPMEPSPRIMEEEIERITEAVVHEKWEELTKNLGDLSAWKERVNLEIDATKQELLRTEKRLEDLQKSVFGKVDEYSKTLTDVNTEIQALSKVFEKIISPLTSNIKELSKITKDLKSKR